MVRDGFGREHRNHPIRRLTPAECDLIEFEGPLVLCEQQMRFFVGPWRRMKSYVISHHRRGSLWQGSERELKDRGIYVNGSNK